MRGYLSGPMTGVEAYNWPAFDKYAAIWRKHGWTIVSPAEMDLVLGYTQADGPTCEQALAWDEPVVASCEAIFLLPGWEHSTGVRRELVVAVAHGLDIFDAVTGDSLWEEVVSMMKPVFQDETRIVDPETGGAKGQKLARFDLVPPRPLWYVAEHFGRGSLKYSERNWEKGYRWSLSIGALERHIQKFKMRDTEESDVYHLSAVAFHALALLEFLTTHPDKDDRP